MKAIRRAGLAAGALVAGSAAAAHAGGSNSANCNCTTPPPPPPCNCTVPNGHQVNIPGVNITTPSIFISAANVEVQASSASSAQASSSASSSAYGSGNAAVSANAYGNALAAANAFGFGSGGGYAAGSGVAASYIPSLQVLSETAETRRVCAEFRSIAKAVAIQAVCLDDKAVPHPASQVTPDRDVVPAYEGEVFRCIAGTHMQYTLADYAGQADFSRGQTVSCLKGEALYHTGSGALACRPQRPARDCNERSLLRRYGAGIKVLKMSAAQQCVSYRSETAEGTTSTPGAMQLDGGVGGSY